jgi:hypothetical protein
MSASRCATVLAAVMMLVGCTAAEEKWIELTPGKDFSAWKEPLGDWFAASGVALDSDNAKLLTAKRGEGIFVNGPKGRSKDLLTKQLFKDVEVHAEFLIAKGSNSGIKLMGLYEIQILDSFGAKELTGDSCGGIYPRAELKPNYHHIDNGTAPRVNAAKPAGEWQTLDIVFTAPRFDADKKKMRNAKFVKVTLNGQVVHENVEVLYPTGHAWHNPEVAEGPLLLQGDHGPVAFRNVRIRPLGEK